MCIVNSSQHLLDNHPQIGSVISVKYSGCYSNGILRKPIFWRERKDIEFKLQQTMVGILSIWIISCQNVLKLSQNSNEDHKHFFDQLANKLLINNYQDWYHVSKFDVYKYGGKKLMQFYDESLYKVLLIILC